MTDSDLSFQQFDVDYENELAMLAQRQADDDAIDAGRAGLKPAATVWSGRSGWPPYGG